MDERQEIDRCKNGYDGLTGHEYFYYNYIKINGREPVMGSYKDFDFGKYSKKIRAIRNMERNIMVPKHLSIHPLTNKESFKLK